jgi:hypothetical protein
MAWLIPFVAGCSVLAVGPFPRTRIPAEIAAPANESLAMINSAQGVQIYRCDPNKDAPGRFEWVFEAPEASLVDENGLKAGRHYDGPTWEALDGSKLVGTVQARKDAPDRTAIPWLRLSARARGTGTLSKISTILRVSTVGGVAPPSCPEQDRGRVLRVDYRADYYFYAPR